MQFTDFLKNYSNKIVMGWLDQESQKKVATFCDRNNINHAYDYDGKVKEEEDFHLTIIASKNKVYVKNGIYQLDKPIQVHVHSIDVIGEKKFLCFKVDVTPEALQLRSVFEEFMEPTFDVWMPHISLSYNGGKYDPNDYSGYDMNLSIDKLKIENLDP